MKIQSLTILRIKRVIEYLFQSHLYLRRWVELRDEEKNLTSNSSSLKQKSIPKLFNLDLHIGVIADLETGLQKLPVSLTRWSISLHNHLIPDRIPISDPVRFVNARKWHLLDDSIIDKFQKRYGNFLNSFDGFICTYSPTFAELFRGLNKPILVIAATRYEAPYTDRPSELLRFNNYLLSGVKKDEILLYANNHGDADYIKFYTNLNTPVVPSLCEKIGNIEKKNQFYVILSKDSSLVNYIEKTTKNIFQSATILGSPYQWIDLIKCSEVLVFPQNISTMTLFELATAGIPVAIPSRIWIKELISMGYQVLNQLTFHQILNVNTASMSEHDPANFNSKFYLDWWLDRADFYNKELMPNVRIVNSIDELISYRPNIQFYNDFNIKERNFQIAKQRKNMILKLLEKI